MQLLHFLLHSLRDAIFLPRDDELLVRSLTAEDLLAAYAPVRHEESKENTCTVISLLSYKDERIRSCVRETKFGDNARAAKLLGHVLVTFLSDKAYQHFIENSDTAILIPIPLSKERMRERGYNQVERILRAARPLPGGCEIRTDLIYRMRATQPQTSLSSMERKKNVQGAFLAKPANPDHTYILVDDVLTTGSTLKEAAAALRASGARRIYCIALAH